MSFRCLRLLTAAFVMRQAFRFPAADHAPIAQWSDARRHRCPLSAAASIVAVNHHPVVRHPKLMRQCGIGKQYRIFALASPRVQHRQPRNAFGIEPSWRNHAQRARLSAAAIFSINIQQFRNRRLVCASTLLLWLRLSLLLR